jgi:dolichyl-phosphate-mannose--protein O-mannosyl transferase
MHTMPAAGAAPSAPAPGVRYGDVIELQHKVTTSFLHSSDLTYIHAKTSHQHQLHGVPASKDEPRNQWRVLAGFGLDSTRGSLIPDGAVVRLENVRTGFTLHSHKVASSPVTGQQEVTGLPGSVHDFHDNWKVETHGSGANWQPGAPIKLIHTHTGGSLHSHHAQFPINAAGEKRQEISVLQDARDENDFWLATVVRALPPAAYAPRVPVCYGDVFHLRHVVTGKYLQSEPFHAYTHARSSKQNIVTCHEAKGARQEWRVLPAHGTDVKSVHGQPIADGATIRLQNIDTLDMIHSHGLPSPNGAQEVTGLNYGDANDNWRVETDDKRGWQSMTYVTFSHPVTNQILRSTRGGDFDKCAGTRCQEVCCSTTRDDNCVWTVVPSPAMFQRAQF